MKKKILIVDDDHDIHPLLVKMIEKVNKPNDSKKFGEIDNILSDMKGQEKSQTEEGEEKVIDFNFDHAFQGEEAIKYVDQAKVSPYDVVFMDVRMPPGIDGIQTIKEIRKSRPDYPFIICTAYMDYTWDEVVKILGSENNIALMKKPFTKQKILENLKTLLKEA